MSKTLVVVGCGAAKRDGPTVAKDLYTSTYFQKKREFAEQRGDFWQILSAEHGLISPELEVAPYDTTISDLTDGELDQLAHEVGMDLIDWMAAHEIDGETVDEIIVLAGKSYIDPLREREAFALRHEKEPTGRLDALHRFREPPTDPGRERPLDFDHRDHAIGPFEDQIDFRP